MNNLIKKNLLGFISIGLSFAILLYFIVFSHGIKSLIDAIESVKIVWVIIAFLFTFIYWLLDALVIFLMTKLKYKNQSFVNSFKTAMIGLFYSALTPFAVGGQPMQIIEMSKNHILISDAGSFITIKSIIYQVCMTVYALFCVIISGVVFSGIIQHFYVYVFFGLIANLIFILFVALLAINKNVTTKILINFIMFLYKLKVVKNPQKNIKSVFTQTKLFQRCFFLIRNDFKFQITAYIITILQLTVFYSIPYCVYKSFGFSGISIFHIISAQAIITMITAFIPLPGASGAAEGSFYLFFSKIFTGATLFPAIFMWRFVTYYSCIIFGGLLSLLGVAYDIKK